MRSEIATNIPVQKTPRDGKTRDLFLYARMPYKTADSSVPTAMITVFTISITMYVVGKKASGAKTIVAKKI